MWLDPTKEQGSIERLLSTHTSSAVTAGTGFPFLAKVTGTCPSFCEAVNLAAYRATVTKEIALNTTPGQVRNKQIEMFNALLLSY